MITIAQLREYYELGVITGFSFVRGLSPNSWMIVIESKEKSWTLKTARNEPRDFKTLEAALSVLEDIGMRVSSLSFRV